MPPPLETRASDAGGNPRAGRVNPGRVAAMERLAQEIPRYPELSLEPLSCRGMPDRDAALAHAVFDVAIRRWTTIGHLLAQFLRQPWESLEAPTAAALLVGSSQMLFFDRVPVHSAIDEAVEWTKGHARPKAAGLVNAVLRRVAALISRQPDGSPTHRAVWGNARDELPLADGRALVLIRPALPPDEMHRAAMATGVPLWQLRRWADQHGRDDAVHVAWHSVCNPPTIVYVGAASQPLEEPLLLPHASADHRVFAGTRADLVALLGRRPDLWVQDPSASAALGLMGSVAPGEAVVDLCAGRGTKTRQLLTRFPDAVVIACEVSDPRLADLATLAGAAQGRLLVRRPEQIATEWKGRCGLVLADVPCSNSGVLARRVEARHRCSARQVTRLHDQQQGIVSHAVSLLGPSGRLVYSTCSLEAEENREVVDWACRTFGLGVETEKQRLPEGGPGRPASEYQDGAFAACLARTTDGRPEHSLGIDSPPA